MCVKAWGDFWNFAFVSNFFGLFGTTSNSVRQTMSCHGSLGCSQFSWGLNAAQVVGAKDMAFSIHYKQVSGFNAIVQQTPPSQLRFEWKSLPADRQGPRNEKSDVWHFRFMS